LNYINYNSW